VDKRRILGKFLNALGWLVVICLVGYGMFYVKDNVKTLEGPVWGIVKAQVERLSAEQLKRYPDGAEGFIQLVEASAFVVEKKYEASAQGETVRCELADRVLVEVRTDAVGQDNVTSSKVMSAEEAMKLLTPGMCVHVQGLYEDGSRDVLKTMFVSVIASGHFENVQRPKMDKALSNPGNNLLKKLRGGSSR
jgi:hypothetical protein